MGYRRFVDREGHSWEVRDQSRSEWHLEPVSGNPLTKKIVNPPGYEPDPFEMSERELQRLLDSGGSSTRSNRPSPFSD